MKEKVRLQLVEYKVEFDTYFVHLTINIAFRGKSLNLRLRMGEWIHLLIALKNSVQPRKIQMAVCGQAFLCRWGWFK
jgi:hypothetical protein